MGCPHSCLVSFRQPWSSSIIISLVTWQAWPAGTRDAQLRTVDCPSQHKVAGTRLINSSQMPSPPIKSQTRVMSIACCSGILALHGAMLPSSLRCE